MWNAICEQLEDGRTLRLRLQCQSRSATVAEVIEAWQKDIEFGNWFNKQLADVPFTAFRWETPAVTVETVHRPFECVLIDSPSLDRPSDPNAFLQHLDQAKDDIVAFPNLGRDAMLVVPCAVGELSAYGHLAAFVRLAPAAQQSALWRAVGAALSWKLSEKPVWLNTAGAGVPWLHVRLDDRPKYYAHAPYRRVVR